jgi:fibronectin type 3 domain-containing protein
MLHTPEAQGYKDNPKHQNVSRMLCARARTLCRPGLAIFVLLLFAVAARPQSGTSHSIKVAWTYTQGTDVATGFNIYRGTVSGGPYTRQDSTPIPIATDSYTDTTGTGGTKYFYVVTAVDATGYESIYSTEVSATMLTNPLAPQAVTAVAQ